ncbi:hypothetical protein SAMN02990966_06442 [Rhodospirillales bacterium URHD0017]|nr:hypothetical protein SAMN02990966_06442 [Rhodospirillales bacterium URHD0017]
MKRVVFLALLVAGAASATAQPTPSSSLDGEWRGKSDGGSCNAPLDFVITIENGFVDGSAFDTTAHGPVPNLKKAPPPAPTPGLWQIHGVVNPSGSFSLVSVASVKATDRRRGKLTARSEGGGLVVSETTGCRRTARLTR